MRIKDVENLAELAKIELTQNEKERLLSDMEGILGYVGEIQKVDVMDVEVKYENKNIWREDLPASGMVNSPRDFSSDLIKKQFPASQDGFVKVKKIM